MTDPVHQSGLGRGVRKRNQTQMAVTRSVIMVVDVVSCLGVFCCPCVEDPSGEQYETLRFFEDHFLEVAASQQRRAPTTAQQRFPVCVAASVLKDPHRAWPVDLVPFERGRRFFCFCCVPKGFFCRTERRGLSRREQLARRLVHRHEGRLAGRCLFGVPVLVACRGVAPLHNRGRESGRHALHAQEERPRLTGL